MNKTVHRAAERGQGEHSWLSTRYSFSFADWYEPSRMGFGKLRVINDDIIAPARGFPPHSHRDMEIITIVRKGAVSHEDSGGGRGVVSAGEVQTMSAGRGVVHSEYNASATEPLELFQIWIEPKEQGIEPHYAQKDFVEAIRSERSVMVAAPEDKTGETLPLAQDAYISIVMVEKDGPFDYMLHKEGNGVYLMVIEGAIDIEGEKLERRDAIGLSDINKVILTASEPSELLLIEVPMD